MTFQDLLGDTLISHEGKVNTSDLAGKTLLIYFSAHWCGPCRGFTPALAEFYKKLKSQRNDFELVFVSSDCDQGAFDEYFKEMPWIALPFEKRDLKETLSGKFKVQGIPTLVVLDKEGNLITQKGREKVSQDPEGKDFPWPPQPLDVMIGTDFVSKDGTPLKKEVKGKVLGLYFSAHWCPPCKAFTPVLASAYTELKNQGKDFELVFVSFDRDEGSFKEYSGEMPWISIPFSDDKRRTTLGDHFEVEGIPSLVFLDENLSIITKNGVAAVRKGLPFPYHPPALDHLDQTSVSDLNEDPCLLVFGEEAEKENLLNSLQPLAEEFQKAKKGFKFFLVTNQEISGLVRKFANLPEKKPLLVMLDIPGQAKFISEAQEVGVETVRAFAEGYEKKTLTPLKIRE